MKGILATGLALAILALAGCTHYPQKGLDQTEYPNIAEVHQEFEDLHEKNPALYQQTLKNGKNVEFEAIITDIKIDGTLIVTTEKIRFAEDTWTECPTHELTQADRADIGDHVVVQTYWDKNGLHNCVITDNLTRNSETTK